MFPAANVPETSESLPGLSLSSRFSDLRSVRWRVNLGVLPSSLSSPIDDIRRVTADSRRSYAGLRRCLLIDPHLPKFADDAPDLVVDNPLSQNPDSTWGRFFRNAELEKMVDKDLSRLYPENGSYFQTSGCQGMLRRILLLWCLRHPQYGYGQGMHELLAPLLYVLHADMQHLNEVRKLYEDQLLDTFDGVLSHESPDFNFMKSLSSRGDDNGFQERSRKPTSLYELDVSVQTIVLLSDPYGAEGELGIVLSEKFMEHDAYSMFDALMSGAGGAVTMAEFFSHSSASASQTGLPPVIEASLALYHLLSIVDSSLYSHLVELGVEPQYFALRWLRVLFGREFSLEDLLIIWDEIFSFDNSKPTKDGEHDPGVLNSQRGAFICAMAVSMMLNVRPSLLATEHAATCLQRLLNFPENIDLDKLMGKAKSLVSLALDANVPSHPASIMEHGNYSKQMGNGGHTHSLSFDSSSPVTPASLMSERYWEEKWRFVRKEEETQKENSPEQVSSRRKHWTEKMKLRLSRTDGDKSSIRRSMLEDLSQQLKSSDDNEEIAHDKSSCHQDSLLVKPDVVVQDVVQERGVYIDGICSGPSTASEERSPAFSDPASPIENGSEKSSIASNISHEINDGETQNSCSFQSTIDEPNLPISYAPNANACGESESGIDNNSSEPSVILPTERKALSGKFQWFWKLGRHTCGEETSSKKLEVDDAKSATGENIHENKAGVSAAESQTNNDPVNVKADACDQNLMDTLRNLGQSMLENIQVVESAFQQDRSEAGSVNHLPEHAFGGKGQVTGATALNELRKISNLLREM